MGALTETGSKRATWCVFPQRFVCLGVDLIDDSTEDDDSLYRDPNKRPPPSVPAARLSPSVPLSSKPQPTRSKSIQTDLSTQSKEDSYVIGTKIEHTSLDWGGGFPGSHDFYRTRDQSDQEIFTLKPNVSAGKSRNKRKYSVLKIVLWRGNPARARQVKVTCLHDQSLRRLTAGPLNYAISSSLLALRRFYTRLCV
ncbi:hypothetical protein CC77DRAFT_1013110 [Alternaria alternata]|uniref:Uncharacterized protein n=1 Tax=Alternaria alternata TaxID=5599 RepID=A0A177D7P3_ALTAL|nr:hypothetical protein CC77DRAFT_1013110 [Alternaria alternata]OAG15556.1 hypothetical protein CC77DRAFT_1013110 [Alternaria alternata]